MAAAVVGGAFLSAFLQVLFDRMASREVVDFFGSSKLGKKKLLQKLDAALLSANAVLDDAEEKQMTSSSVARWVDELKDAVYDADDLFDEIATENLKREAGIESRPLACKVWSFASDACMSRFGDKLEKVLERLESVVKQRQVLGLREGIRERTPRALPTTSLVEESGVFGREKDREAVVELLLSDRSEKNTIVRLESCKHCVSLPPLGQLPSLEELIIKGFDGVTRVGNEFNGSNCIPFQSLKYLEFADMCSWKEWASFAIRTEGLAFAHLQELCIINCPELSGGLPSHLPSLSALSIEKCPQLTSSLPFAPLLRKIDLDDCGNVSGVEPLLNGTELQDMEIKNLSTLPLRFLPPTMTRLNLEDSHEIELPIHRCHESLQYLNLKKSCDSLISFPLEVFPSLKNIQLVEIEKLEHLSNSDGSPLLLHSMNISDCPEFRSFPAGGLAAPYLTSLELNDCRHLKHLPENMQALLPSLRSLKISSCPQLMSFPERGLPSKLVALSLSNCDKLITGRKDWGLQSLCSLKTFVIEQEKNIESFPEMGLLPASLTSLYIVGFDNLTSLNSKGLHSLSSLENLFIGECPKLHSFPKEGQILPASLTTLLIYDMGLKSLDNLGLHHLTCLENFRIIGCGSLRSMPAEGLSSSLSNLFIYRCASHMIELLALQALLLPRSHSG
ncbi:hypothetical protein NL676_022317 [Syzygium grande]|nr:hypothetical protein NL676_022317 [Syzygium grande]